MAQYLKKGMRKPRNIFLTFCFSWCGLKQWITGTECILNYIGVNIDISQNQSSAFSPKKVWFCFSQLLDDTLSRNEDLNKSFSSRNTFIESWDEVTPHRNDNDVRSDIPVKDIFSSSAQTIRKCTREKGSQYQNMMIKNKLTQTINEPRLFTKSVSTQTLPIPCTFADSEKNDKKWQCIHTWKYLKLLFQEV